MSDEQPHRGKYRLKSHTLAVRSVYIFTIRPTIRIVEILLYCRH